MVEYIREYIKRNFSPDNLEDITWYVYGKLKRVEDISSHKYDYEIDKLASGYLCEYYKKKFSEEEGSTDDKNGSKSEYDIPLWEEREVIFEDKVSNGDVLDIFDGLKESDERIIDGIAACLAKKSVVMFNLHVDLKVVSTMVFQDMCNNKKDMLNEISKKIEAENAIFEDIFDDSFDEYLTEYIVNLAINMEDILELKKSFWSVRNYILSKMKKRYMHIVSRDEVIKKRSWVKTYELLSKKINYSLVLAGDYDNDISRMIAQDEVEVATVGDGVIKVDDNNKRKNRIVKGILLAIAIVVLIFSNTEFGKEFFSIDKFFETPNEWETVADADPYEYPTIEDLKDDDLQETIQNVISSFYDYRKLNAHPNDRFEQLCLYRAFDSIQNHDLEVMENIFRTVKERFSVNGKRDYIMRDNFESVSGYDSYLWYVYDMMKIAGLEVTDYVAPINEYLGFYRGTNGGEPQSRAYDSISDESRELIDKMLREYGKLCNRMADEMEKQQNGERSTAKR